MEPANNQRGRDDARPAASSERRDRSRRPGRASRAIAGGLALGVWAAGAQSLTLEALLDAETAPRTETFRVADGVELEVDLYVPDGHATTDKRAALIVLHGGGWSAPGRPHMVHLCRYLAARGMVAANLQYRLVSTTNDVRIGDCVNDAWAGLRYLRTNAAVLGIDPERLGVAGDSAGGQLAAALALGMGAGKDDVRPAAAVLYNPCVDLPNTPWMEKHAGIAPRAGETADGGWQTRAERVSPLQHVLPGCPPVLLMHGTADACVPVLQADRFAQAMVRDGNAVTYHRMEGWRHAFVIPGYGAEEQVVETLRRTDAFLAGLGWLAGEPILEPRPRPPAEQSQEAVR